MLRLSLIALAAPIAIAGGVVSATPLAQAGQTGIVPAPAPIHYPVLTGRVVDDAKLLDPASEQKLASQAAALERATGHQFVIVTVPSLQGASIERFSHGLGNQWGIGRKRFDDGVLLVVAPDERMVRIEVGDGLTSKLSDEKSQRIIDAVMLPHFRHGELQQGIVTGAEAIIAAIEPQGNAK